MSPTRTKTANFNAYHPWGSSAYCVDVRYFNKVLKTFDGDDYDVCVMAAKAWALIQGFTHYTQGGERGEL
jgi:hypothetical protein